MIQLTVALSDRQAAEAVQARIDWKYCLGLELDDPGVDVSVLSQFRDERSRRRPGLRVRPARAPSLAVPFAPRCLPGSCVDRPNVGAEG